MRFSLIIAAHNEGDSLWQTVASSIEGLPGARDYEMVVADDASDDGSVEEMLCRFPHVRVVRHEQRRGASPTKDLGARHATGEVLVFLDGHAKPEPGAILRLVEDVGQVEGKAVVTPTIQALDVARWQNIPSQVGHGYRLDLERFDCGWLSLCELRAVQERGRRFYESPALIGCALAVSRGLYDDLRGFDPQMRIWGVEDLDFGLKCWLMGFAILHDPEAVIGHRFRERFDNYDVPIEHLVVNQLRMARKNSTQSVWSQWAEGCRARHPGGLADDPQGLWGRIWQFFEAERKSVEHERSYLLARRLRDEFWYAERFGLRWPRLELAGLAAAAAAIGALTLDPSPSPSPTPSPSPPPVTVDLDIDGVPDDEEVTVGGLVVRRHDGNNAPRKEITLASSATTGNVTLTCNNAKVKVFDAASDGAEITFDGSHNKFPVTELPKSLYVQGDTGSSTMRDVTLTLTHDGGASDTVRFTVLWVTITTKHSGTVSADNSARDVQNSVLVPPSFNLGEVLLVFDSTFVRERCRTARGTEFIGTVAPSDFVPAEFAGSMYLDREVLSLVSWEGIPNGNEDAVTVPSGPDTSGPEWRDDDPQSAGSAGKIYDLDYPGQDAIWTQTPNMIQRNRMNFRAWAVYDGVRCSLKKECYTRQSYKLTGSIDSGTAESGGANTITDSNKNWAANTWAPGAIKIKAGTGARQCRRVTANTATKITVATDWAILPDSTSEYMVINTSTWSHPNDVPNDNQNADGTTNISWDLQPPVVTSITPNQGTTGTTVTIDDLAGTSFGPGATIKLTKAGLNDIVATDVVWVSVTKYTCKFNLAGATTGSWSVQVTNVDGAGGTLGAGFTVNPP